MLEGRNVVVYDCEIKQPIDGKEVTWQRFDRMGISVACLYDYETGDYNVYTDDIWRLVNRLNRPGTLIVAFNQKGFDNLLLRGSGFPLKEDGELSLYDMLEESRWGLGWEVAKPYPSGLRLDNHLSGTFGAKFQKTAHGAEAPWMFRNGEMGRLVSYNIADVHREKSLFEYIWHHRKVVTDTHGEIKVRDPRGFFHNTTEDKITVDDSPSPSVA